MNTKERLLGALKGTQLDRVPCICPGGMMNMIVTELMHKTNILWPDAHTDVDKMSELAKSVYEYGMFENYGVPFCMTVEVEGMGAEVDLGDTKFEPRVVSYVLDTVSDYNKLKQFDIKAGRAKVSTDVISRLKSNNEGVPVIGNLSGPISVASSLMEPVVFYKELRRKKEDAHKFMGYVTNQILAFGKAQVEAGADVITISDPSGTGEILGPDYFDEYAVKYLNKLIDRLHEVNKKIPIIVHICGQMHRVYPELNKIKADALSFDAIVSIKEVKEQMPDRIIMGNLSTYALEFSNKEKIKTMTKSVLNSGVNIISPACGLGTQSSLENIQAMLAAVKEETHD
ncbi:MtaA/CmuA family methyltransferase [Tissierella creatinophila]|uniref:Uroporphyrinogen decarboxylase n=1 Tax=Tissierella creatinophila DSM 6911 TaxID=1123403 RepID=A0A1U7M4F2_TISCR|nr:MtaA/CmuA family methyltransferase [Tissierella creatinophila]OLS02193.1 uroporphyrinogen decarboxylase [Tissierella creatinophila DSM 6911]